jgi:hypothetical protein
MEKPKIKRSNSFSFNVGIRKNPSKVLSSENKSNNNNIVHCLNDETNKFSIINESSIDIDLSPYIIKLTKDMMIKDEIISKQHHELIKQSKEIIELKDKIASINKCEHNLPMKITSNFSDTQISKRIEK